jgi:hypothetical protein
VQGLWILPGIHLWDGLGELTADQSEHVAGIYGKNGRPSELELLKKNGSYRLVMTKVRPGTVYSDTCIAEVRFNTVLPDFWTSADPFYAWVEQALHGPFANR